MQTHYLCCHRIVASQLRWSVTSLLILICWINLSAFGQDSGLRLASIVANPKSQTLVGSWPFAIKEGQFQIHSTVPVAKLEPSLTKLACLPNELTKALAIPIADQPIHIVVLESRDALDTYVKRLLPDAPSRRALYIRHRGPGLVLTYYNSAWLTDVRHESTHALLDASNVKLPQWLDEGLAEYFESATENPVDHPIHRVAVQSQVRFGQVPDIEQLELMDSNSVMTAKDYRDAWSIVAFLLNSSAESKGTFQTYLLDLQNRRSAGFLSHRLKPSISCWRDEFSKYYRR